MLGSLPILVGGVFAFGDGQTEQTQRDDGKGFSAADARERANTRGAINAVPTSVGALGGAAIGAAIGGPIGAIIGGVVGGWLGSLAGDLISDEILK